MKPSIPIIDAHVHFFDLTKGDYHWLKTSQDPNIQAICNNVGEADITLAEPLALAGFLHIEAGFDNTQPWREIAWLERHCTLPFRNVACANLLADDFSHTVNRLSQYPSVTGIRHILDEQAASILNNPKAQQHLAMLAEKGWRFDAQLTVADPDSLQALLKTLGNHPTLKVIINHAGNPALHQPDLPWQNAIEQLAQYLNVALKLSGWEMTNTHWRFEQVTGAIAHCLTCFGHHRVMLGSNFPLCLWRNSYRDLWQEYTDYLYHQAPQIFADNARHWYAL